MNLCLINHSFRYELEKLVRIFLPFEKILFFDKKVISDCCAFTEISGNTAVCEVLVFGKTEHREIIIDGTAPDAEKEKELKLATALYECFTAVFDCTPEWGMLTGIRPAKLYSRLSDEYSQKGAEIYLKDTLKVSPKKIGLCRETFLKEENIISRSSPDSYSLYISIPFCPSRCSYCSFVSHSVEAAKKLIPEYTEKLCREIAATARIAEENGLKLETVYIGGGTPTSLEAAEIAKIMQTVSDNFDIANVKEYTVEAGRPDTVTPEKLEVIKRFGAGRISINPQTMNDSVLKAIGRRHTANETVSAFYLARKMGFTNINTDLIAGLPGDSFESFCDTLNKVASLNPESVTVHSLSLKRSSRMTKQGDFPDIEAGKTASLMVDYAHTFLKEKGIFPYYMYRQSKTVGNLENVGYSKTGFECLYNVYIMDETHTILACGASAVTKLRQPGGSYIQRIFNFKYPYEYIDRFDEQMQRKSGIGEFYAEYGNRNK